jgi:anthranilate/para-aminobenzoate synthase component I
MRGVKWNNQYGRQILQVYEQEYGGGDAIEILYTRDMSMPWTDNEFKIFQKILYNRV